MILTDPVVGQILVTDTFVTVTPDPVRWPYIALPIRSLAAALKYRPPLALVFHKG
jgi:hypothetical protein